MTVRIPTGDIRGLSTPVIDFLLAGESDFLAALRLQFAHAKITKITEDGYGFYVEYETESSLRILNPQLQGEMVNGIVGIDNQGECICGFALFMSDGMISYLDGYPFLGDTWPDEMITLKYVNRGMDGKEYFTSIRGQAELKEYIFPEKIEFAHRDVIV